MVILVDNNAETELNVSTTDIQVDLPPQHASQDVGAQLVWISLSNTKSGTGSVM